MAKKILGIDYGEARTGLAVSDALGFLASGIGNIEERDINRLINKIAEKAAELSVELIVLGNPVNMNGTLGPKAEKVAKLISMPPLAFDISSILEHVRKNFGIALSQRQSEAVCCIKRNSRCSDKEFVN